jgi:hypothetical protein
MMTTKTMLDFLRLPMFEFYMPVLRRYGRPAQS